ncbi:hypothetical protein Ndes2437B_g05503 [Nannochloris sp. 'desiccata']
MESQKLQESLNATLNALENIKERLHGSSEEEMPPQKEELEAVFGQAIANLNAQLNNVAEAPQPQQQQPPQERAVEVNEDEPVEIVDKEPQAPPSVAAAGHKFIEVPRRQRTGDVRRNGPHLKSFTLELPATPFHPKTNGADSIPAATAQRTPGIPANTPMAAEVLASLCALGLQFPAAGQQNSAAVAAIAAPRPPRAAALQAATMPASLGRRAAAVRAAEASAALAVSRPRPFKTVSLESGGASPTDPASARKSCNCKRSQCLKLYCECFAAGGFCLPSCQCYNCLNTNLEAVTVEATRAAILAKNPRAFTDKVVGDAHKKGCRCKRSKCLKKYCECYNAGVKCNPEICQCVGCHNTSDRDPGDAEFGEEPLPYGMEDKYDYDDELDAAAEDYGHNKGSAPVATTTNNENAQVNINYGNNTNNATESMQCTVGTINELNGRTSAPAGGPPVEDAECDDPVRRIVLNAVAKAVAAEATTTGARNNKPQQPTLQQQQQQHHLQSIAAALKSTAPTDSLINKNINNNNFNLGAEVVTPGGPLGAGPSALVSHLSREMGVDGEDVVDTATSPAMHAAARMAAQAHLNRRLAGGTMTAAAVKAAGVGRSKSQATSAVDTPVGSVNSAGGDGSRGKRPRRAASGGVQGAVAAATSDWGLDLVSPPPKRSHSVPDAIHPGKGTAAAARRDRDTLLRRALQNDAALATAQGQQHVGTEADAISALVSMNAPMS